MLTGLLIFLVAVIALFAIPVVIEFAFEWPRKERNQVVLIWALGLVRKRIRIDGSDQARTTKAKGPKSERFGGDQPMNVLAAVRQRSFRQRVYRFVGDLWNSIKKENVRVRARIGLDDPADTGKLWAIIGPATLAWRMKRLSRASSS